MAKRWVARWSPTRPGEKGSYQEVLRVRGRASIESLLWRLPPSKSHAIRLLALAAQSNDATVLNNMANAGQDVVSMRRCLGQMGVVFEDLDATGEVLPRAQNNDDQPHGAAVAWRVYGVGPHGLRPPTSVLHAGNSGTALRILMALVAQFSVPVMLDGDASLRSRSYTTMLRSLQRLGVTVSFGVEHERLPVVLQGPVSSPGALQLDATASSQPTTAWCLAAPGLPGPIHLQLEGEAVSRRHAELTRTLCKATGSSDFEDGRLVSWEPRFSQGSFDVPPDCSMLAFAFLATKVHGCDVHIAELPLAGDSLGHEVLFTYAAALGVKVDGSVLSPDEGSAPVTMDLRDANDLITPLAAMMALGRGGTVSGAAHAANKETNRLSGTQRFLAQFGIDCTPSTEGLVVPGGQSLRTPVDVVETFGDHRMQLTALVLASALEATTLVNGPRLHRVADPAAVERLKTCGVAIDANLHAGW